MRSGTISTGSESAVSTLPRRAIVASHLLSESIWVYALGAAIGAMSGNGRGPLAWWTVACLLTGSYLVMRFLQLVRLPTMLARWTNALIAGLAVYAAIGAQFPESAVDFNWALHLAGNDDPQSFDFIAIVGGLLGVGLWWRGGSLTLMEQPIENLELSFKLGLLALAIAAGVDMLASDDLNILPFMFIFFAASLTGLSIGNLRSPTTEASREKRWVRTIAAVVGGVLGAGLIFAIMGRFVLSWLSGPAVWLLGLLSNAVFYAIILPLAYVFGYIAQGVLAVLKWLIGDPEDEGQQEGAELGGRLRELQELENEAPGYLAYVEWTVVALVVLVALFFLGRAFRRRMVRIEQDEEALRESVAEDADVASDLARLLYRLMPDRFKRQPAAPGLRIPEGDADVADVFRIYFGMLSLAERSGFPRPPSETPREYQDTLKGLFPQDLVHRVTSAFNRACYGHQAPPREQIDEMQLALDQLAKGGG